MLCPNCGREETDDTAFCSNCGADFPETKKAPSHLSADHTSAVWSACPSCGAKNEKDALLCSLCGTVFSFQKHPPASDASNSNVYDSSPDAPSSADASASAGSAASAHSAGSPSFSTMHGEYASSGTSSATGWFSLLIMLCLIVFLAGGGWFAWRLWHGRQVLHSREALQANLKTFEQLTRDMDLRAEDKEHLEATFAFLESYTTQARTLAQSSVINTADRDRVIGDVFRALIDMHDLCDEAWVEDTTNDKLKEMKPQIDKLEAPHHTPFGDLYTVFDDGTGRKLKPTEYMREKLGDAMLLQLDEARVIYVLALMSGVEKAGADSRKVYNVPYSKRLMEIAAGFGYTLLDLSKEVLDERFGADLEYAKRQSGASLSP